MSRWWNKVRRTPELVLEVGLRDEDAEVDVNEDDDNLETIPYGVI